MASSESTTAPPLEVAQIQGYSEATPEPMAVTSTSSIPIFNNMANEGNPFEKEFLVAQKRDSRMSTFGNMRAKEQGNWFGRASSGGMTGPRRSKFIEGNMDDDSPSSLHGSMDAVATARMPEGKSCSNITGKRRMKLGVPQSEERLSTKLTPTPSEILKTKSANQSLKKVERVASPVPMPGPRGLWQRTKLWVKRTPKRICKVVPGLKNKGTAPIERISQVAMVRIEDETEEKRDSSPLSRSSSHEEEDHPASLTGEETQTRRNQVDDFLDILGMKDTIDPHKRQELMKKAYEPPVEPRVLTPDEQEEVMESFRARFEPKKSRPVYSGRTAQSSRYYSILDLSEEAMAERERLWEKQKGLRASASTQRAPISNETGTVAQTNDAEEKGPVRSSSEISKESKERRAKEMRPERRQSRPDRQKSFRSATPQGRDPRANLWSKVDQGRRKQKNGGTWKMKWRGI